MGEGTGKGTVLCYARAMDFGIPDDVQDLLDRAKAFMEETVYPLEPIVAQKGFDGAKAELDAARAVCKKAGMWAPQLPQELASAL